MWWFMHLHSPFQDGEKILWFNSWVHIFISTAIVPICFHTVSFCVSRMANVITLRWCLRFVWVEHSNLTARTFSAPKRVSKLSGNESKLEGNVRIVGFTLQVKCTQSTQADWSQYLSRFKNISCLKTLKFLWARQYLQPYEGRPPPPWHGGWRRILQLRMVASPGIVCLTDLQYYVTRCFISNYRINRGVLIKNNVMRWNPPGEADSRSAGEEIRRLIDIRFS